MNFPFAVLFIGHSVNFQSTGKYYTTLVQASDRQAMGYLDHWQASASSWRGRRSAAWVMPRGIRDIRRWRICLASHRGEFKHCGWSHVEFTTKGRGEFAAKRNAAMNLQRFAMLALRGIGP